MQPDTRACIAYISGRIIQGNQASLVYDYTQSEYITFDGEVSPQRVNVYDNKRYCQIGGSGKNNKFNLYDSCLGNHIEIF